MKTKKDFFDDFFTRLAEKGFRVERIMESDVAAEVYDESSLFCVVTQDGELVFEKYESGKARILEQAAEDSRAVPRWAAVHSRPLQIWSWSLFC